MNAAIRSSAPHFSKFGKAAKSAGRKMSIGMTLPLMTLATVSILTAARFEKSMNMVQAATGATKSQFKMLEKQAMHLGATTQFTATQAAEGQRIMAVAGMGVNRTYAAMPHVLNLAAATQSSMTLATEVLTGVMAGYNLKSTELARVTDLLTKTTLTSRTNLSKLGQSFRMVASLASMTGFKLSEMAAAIGELATTSIPASKISTLLKRTIQEMLNPTKRMLQVMRAGHIVLRGTNGQLLSMVKIIKNLEKAHITVTGLSAMFGDQAGPIMAALVQKGSKALLKYQKVLLDNAGITKKVAIIQMRGLTGAYLKLKSAAQALAITTIFAVEPALLSVARAATKWMLIANNSSNAVKRWAARLIGLGIVLGPVIAGMGSFMFQAAMIINALPILAAAVSAVGTAFAAAWGFITLPISLVVIAITAVGVAIYEVFKHQKAIENFLLKIVDVVTHFKKLKAVISSIGATLVHYFLAPMQEAILKVAGLTHSFSRIFHHKATMNAQVTHLSGGVTTQPHKVHTTVDVNVFDPHRYVKNIAGRTDEGDLNLNLGYNMAFAR